MKSVSDICPLCGAATFTRLYAVGEADGQARHAVQCKACNFVHMTPRLTESFLADYYNAAQVYSYGSNDPRDYAAIVADRTGLIDRLLNKAHDAPRQGMAVDYGAGAGATVKALAQLGFDALGVDLSEKSCATAKRLFGVEMRSCDLDQLPEANLSLLTMFDVMEHVLTPVQFVETLYTRLRPGGVAVIGVPNYASLDRMVNGTGAQVMVFPEHVNYFTRQTLTRLFENAGYKTCYIGSPPPYGVAISFGVRRFLYRIFGRNGVTRGLGGLLAAIKKYIVYPLPNAFVERSGMFGHSLIIVAQRPL